MFDCITSWCNFFPLCLGILLFPLLESLLCTYFSHRLTPTHHNDKVDLDGRLTFCNLKTYDKKYSLLRYTTVYALQIVLCKQWRAIAIRVIVLVVDSVFSLNSDYKSSSLSWLLEWDVASCFQQPVKEALDKMSQPNNRLDLPREHWDQKGLSTRACACV